MTIRTRTEGDVILSRQRENGVQYTAIVTRVTKGRRLEVRWEYCECRRRGELTRPCHEVTAPHSARVRGLGTGKDQDRSRVLVRVLESENRSYAVFGMDPGLRYREGSDCDKTTPRNTP